MTEKLKNPTGDIKNDLKGIIENQIITWNKLIDIQYPTVNFNESQDDRQLLNDDVTLTLQTLIEKTIIETLKTEFEKYKGNNTEISIKPNTIDINKILNEIPLPEGYLYDGINKPVIETMNLQPHHINLTIYLKRDISKFNFESTSNE